MRKLTLLTLSLTVAGFGCGTDELSMCGDGGCPADGSVAADGPMQWGLTEGMGTQYNVTSIANAMDPCEVFPGMVVGASLPVSYTRATGALSIGNTMGSPPTPSLGTGTASGNKATLMASNKVGDPPCVYMRDVTSQFELIGHDKFTLAVTEKLSAFTGCAPADVPAGGMCTSTWTWTLEKKP